MRHAVYTVYFIQLFYTIIWKAENFRRFMTLVQRQRLHLSPTKDNDTWLF